MIFTGAETGLYLFDHNLLGVLETHLDGRDWLVGSKPTIADVVNYAYIAQATEVGLAA